MAVQGIQNFDSGRIRKTSGVIDSTRIRKTGTSKTFSVPNSDKALSTPKIIPGSQTGGLQKLLSVEEIKTFEMLFPVENVTSTARPLQAYSIQRNVKQDQNTGHAQEKMLGSRLDIRG